MVENLRVTDHQLSYGRRGRQLPRVRIAITAPDVSEFTLNGSQHLTLVGFDQEQLEVKINGSGRITGAGRAERVDVHINGSGDVDLGQVKTTDAEIKIAGSGEAVVAATGEVEVHIAGSGDVTLAARPTHVETHIAGSGRVIERMDPPPPAATT